MTLLRQVSALCIVLGSTITQAADLPKSILPDNVVLCLPASGCTNKVFLGRNYKMMSTPRFVVMVSISKEGAYTRADVSIANNTSLPLNITPEDFRVEVINPKPKVLLYIPPAELKDLPEPASTATASPYAAPRPVIELPSETTPTVNIDELYEAAKKRAALQGEADLASSKRHLVAVSIPPNELVRGRVYFERDRKAQNVNIVLPIAGVVFEFPYVLPR